MHINRSSQNINTIYILNAEYTGASNIKPLHLHNKNICTDETYNYAHITESQVSDYITDTQ